MFVFCCLIAFLDWIVFLCHLLSCVFYASFLFIQVKKGGREEGEKKRESVDTFKLPSQSTPPGLLYCRVEKSMDFAKYIRDVLNVHKIFCSHPQDLKSCKKQRRKDKKMETPYTTLYPQHFLFVVFVFVCRVCCV